MKNLSLKGVIIGSVVDIIATNLVAIPVFLYAALSHNLAALPKEQVSAALMQVLRSDPVIFSTQLLLGSLCSVLSGYVAARIAKGHEVLNGALASFLCVGSGVYALLFSSVPGPLWHHLLGFVASPALAALGGYLRLKTRGNADAQGPG
ncbi:MAG: hypothetical protein ACRCTU_18000 [Zoogloea sp.]|uniref:hypothetical protein n=1 Tax=Zoogloea sp. TaxID=49181 RepID=UPI003F3DAFE7